MWSVFHPYAISLLETHNHIIYKNIIYLCTEKTCKQNRVLVSPAGAGSVEPDPKMPQSQKLESLLPKAWSGFTKFIAHIQPY